MKKIVTVLLTFVMIFTLASCANVQKSDWQDHLDLGQKYLLDGDYEQAIIEFNKVIEIEPKNVDAYLGLIEAYIAKGDYDSAEDALRKGLEAIKDRHFIKTAYKTICGPVADDFSWSIKDNTLIISGHGSMDDYEVYYVNGVLQDKRPWGTAIDEVTSIVINDGITYLGDSAFSQFKSVETVSIPESVLYIGKEALGHMTMQSVFIPKSVQYIDPEGLTWSRYEEILVDQDNLYYCSIDGVLYSKDLKEIILYPEFKNCPQTYDPSNNINENFHIPESVERIGEYAFSGYPFSEFTFPPNITSIADHAFTESSNIAELHIPKTIKSIEGNPFYQMTSLQNIYVDDDNTNYCSIDGVLFTKDMKDLICYPAGKELDTYSVPDGVQTIKHSAFRNCRANTIIMPETVTYFGGDIIISYIKDIYLTENVTDIEYYAIPSKCTIHAPSGSYAEQYANENGIPFVAE